MQERKNNREKMIDVIRKLQALAGNNANAKEAALAAAKAAELILQYSIEEAELVKAGTVSAEAYETRFIANVREKAQQVLLNAVAKATFCKMFVNNMGKNHVYGECVGKPSNLDVVQYLYTYLWREVQRLRAADYKANGHGLTVARHWNSFCLGATTVIYSRLEQQRRDAEAELGKHGDATRALVVSVDAELKDATERLVGPLRTRKAHTSRVDPSAYYAGAEAGKNIPLNRAITSGN